MYSKPLDGPWNVISVELVENHPQQVFQKTLTKLVIHYRINYYEIFEIKKKIIWTISSEELLSI